MLPWTALAAAAALAIMQPWRTAGWKLRTSAASPPPADSVLNSAPQRSVAVLPFVDATEKRDQEYFSDGLSEDLIDLLTKIPELGVPARTSSFYFKDRPEATAAIAQKLHVSYLLEGSVRKSADRLHVAAQLIRADNGHRLWSETYERDLKDVFKVQEEIAAAVAAALNVTPPPHMKTATRGAAYMDAYNQYLIGRELQRRDKSEDWRLSIAALRKAIALDPSYGAAYAARRQTGTIR